MERGEIKEKLIKADTYNPPFMGCSAWTVLSALDYLL
jgi:hypothetical protein